MADKATVRVRFDWPDHDPSPATAVNRFAVLDDGDGEIILCIGFGAPSINQTGPDAPDEAVVHVNPIMRAVMTRATAEKLRDLLDSYIGPAT